jgi:hypothetical protein
MGGWRAHQLVFLDESGINARTGQRTHGWGLKGRVIRHKVPGSKGENFSVLPAMTIDGYIACKIYQGSVNAETFKAFVIDDLLPLCSPWPGSRSVIVMDNATIHNVCILSFRKQLTVGYQTGDCESWLQT